MKKAKYYILALLIPMYIFIYLFIINNIYPFGDEIINIYDSYSMYPSIIIELVNKIRTGSSLFYTFHGVLGTNFISIVNLYGGSPLNLLFIFFNIDQIYLFYALLIIFKAGLSGLTMFIYLNQNNKCKRNLLFSIIYALSSFAIIYSYHVMWTDALYLAPLVLLGIDKIFSKDSSIFYIIILSITIIINYYTGYMICIFSVIYFIYKLVLFKGNRKKAIIKFLLSSLLCGVITAVVTIPSAFALLSGRSGFLSTTDYFSFNLTDIKTFFYNLLPASFIITDNYNEGTAVLSSSTLVLVLFIYYFFNKKISLKEKITTLIIFIFFFLSITFNLFDYFWNMLSCPIWWNSRYSFLFILFMIIIAYRSFDNISDLKINKIVKSIILILCFVIFLVSFSFKYWGTQPKNLVYIAFLVSMVFFTLYYFLIPLKFKFKNILIFILVIIEIFLNGLYLFYIYENQRYIYSSVSQIMYAEEDLVNALDESDLSRTYDFGDSQENNGLFYGFNSTSLFSSVYNGDISNFYQTYFNTGGTNHTYITNPTLPLLSFLNVKYFLNYSDNYLNCTTLEPCINEYSIGIGYLIDDGNSIDLEEENIINNINIIYSYLLGYDVNLYYGVDATYSYENVELFENGNYAIVDADSGTMTIEFTAEYSGILSTSNDYNLYDMYINDDGIEYFTMTTYVNKGDKVKIVYISSDPSSFSELDHKFYILNMDLFKEVTEEVSSKSIEVIEDDNYIFKGIINVEEDNQKLFLTIPYDQGLKVFVDGEVVEINKEFNAFISINLTKGEHTITIEYTPQGFNLGLIISLSGISMFIVYIGYKIYKKKHLVV